MRVSTERKEGVVVVGRSVKGRFSPRLSARSRAHRMILLATEYVSSLSADGQALNISCAYVLGGKYSGLGPVGGFESLSIATGGTCEGRLDWRLLPFFLVLLCPTS